MELDPQTTATVVVHCQGDVVGPTGAFADFFHQQFTERHIVERIAEVNDAVRAAGGTVVYTRVGWNSRHTELRLSPLPNSSLVCSSC